MAKERIVKRCICCRQIKVVEVNKDGYIRWQVGEAHIQDALPELSAGDRELLISGVCSTCFDEMFAGEEE